MVFGAWLGTLFELGRRDQALAAAERRVRQTGAPADEVTRALVLLQIGRADEGLADLGRIARERPDDVEIQALVIGLAATSGDAKLLLESADRLLATGGGSAFLFALRAVALADLDRYDEALKAADDGLALDPDSSQLRDLRARIERQRSAKTGKPI